MIPSRGLRALESVRVGFLALVAHKLRSLLATLGIVFGVAAVIAMLAVGEGAKREALAKYEAWGSENIIIRDTGTTWADRKGNRASFSSGLSRADARALADLISTAAYVVPQADSESAIVAGDEETKALVVATGPSLAEVMNLNVDHGRFLHELDLQNRSKVCILGYGVARALFPVSPAVGRRVKIGTEWFLVVGVMQSTSKIAESAGVLATRDLNRDIYIPLDTALSRRALGPPESELTQLTIRVHPGASVQATAVAAKRIVERRHYGADDYGLVVPEELIREKQKEQHMFNVVLGAIAAISLLVGGIGIMNIMLASVLERRREIGVRRALGARKGDILSQFLAEAATISLTGGIIGIGLGILLAKSIRLVAQFEATPTVLAIVVAFGVSVTTGLVFGYYPARRAAGTHPIEALRYE